MTQKKEKSQVVSIRMHAKNYKQLKMVSVHQDLSVSDIINESVGLWMEKHYPKAADNIDKLMELLDDLGEKE